jgi:hypothetical protein
MNIHVLPTDKPSRLFNYKGEFGLAKGFQNGTDVIVNQNIYITSDEEIKKGDYRYSTVQNNIELVTELSLKVNKEYWKLNPHLYKKIILTDNPDLIVDSVQAIDDEFLEWFVKNPSCEYVRFERERYGTVPYLKMRYVKPFKIIIPKEESKQETLEEVAEKHASYDNDYVPLSDGEHDFNEGFKNAFLNGFKLAQERMYSEGIDLFITEIKTEFKDENWDYLDFIKERVLEQLKNK